MSKLMQQITVARVTPEGIHAFTTWVEKDDRLKVGRIIMFKDHMKDEEFTVTDVYNQFVEFDTIARQRDFDNNNYDKHEGLKLK